MKRPEANIDDVLGKILHSTPEEEMEAAGSRVLQRLREDNANLQLLPAQSSGRQTWKLLAVTATIVVLLVSAALATAVLVRTKKEGPPKVPVQQGASSETLPTPKTESQAARGEPVRDRKSDAAEAKLRQSAPASSKNLQFEVASLRPESSQTAGGDEGEPFMDCQGTNGRVRGGAALAPPLGRCVGRHASLMTLISVAYGLDELDWLATSKAGNSWPAWMNDPREHGYQVEARAENPATTTKEQLQQMLQALLADRFKLQVSWQTGEVNGYVLVRANGGPKLKEASVEEPLTFTRKPIGDTVLGIVTGRASMKDFAQFLSGRVVLQARVADGTNFKGIYEINVSALRPTPPRGSDGAPGGPRSGGAGVGGPSDSFLALQDALQQQMGLQLNATKIPAKLIVIDHAEMPPSN
jgi:uncharacterized protein (TIGR03435 family)